MTEASICASGLGVAIQSRKYFRQTRAGWRQRMFVAIMSPGQKK